MNDWDVSRMMKKQTPSMDNAPSQGNLLQRKPALHGWKLQLKRASMVSLAVAACWSIQAQALSLSTIRVTSALGEPLHAQIDLTQLTADDLATLSASIANAEAYKAAGLEYGAALSSVVVSVQKTADGRAHLLLRSDRPINDPFIDMIVEVNWATGRIVRDYTILLDPRTSMRSPVAPMPAMSPAVSSSAPWSTTDGQPAKKTGVAAPVVPSSGSTVTVQAGDTAGKIALAHLQSGVSLEQMLASMLNANPQAFINGDINRIKAGALIQAPDAQAASLISPQEARQTLVASSKNFGEYRQRAALIPTESVKTKSDRQSSGQVQTKIEDKAPASGNPDKLRLSQAKVQSGTSAADDLAKQKKVADTQTRTTELNKNIADLKQVGTAASKAGMGSALPGIAAPAALSGASSASTTSTQTVTASLAVGSSTLTVTATGIVSPTLTASATPAPVKPRVVSKPPMPEPSFMDKLFGEPLYAIGAAGLLAALLGGFVFWRKNRNGADGNVDSSFLASRLQPDSFFSGSGGQQVNTSESDAATGSSMMYSPSQLDAAGDVDPVAEAEVYIAYGRDLQAEEILKEALRTQGSRVAIHVKLLEIYAKRRDAKAFDLVSREVYNLTNGQGADWDRVCQIGNELNPSEPMYQPGGKPSDAKPKTIVESSVGGSSFADSTQPPRANPLIKAGAAVPLDLNLDALHASEVSKAPPNRFESTMPMPISAAVGKPAPAVLGSNPTPNNESDLMFTVEKAPAPEAPSKPAVYDNALSFDLGSLSLDLPKQDPIAPAVADNSKTSGTGDPMDTKLQLAAEFHALGDIEGARALAQEVITQAEGETKAKAQKLLSQWV
jgi:pilus assembly protein FimV